MPERAGERDLGWLWNNLILGFGCMLIALLGVGFAIVVVVFLTVSNAVSDRLIHYQREFIDHLRARNDFLEGVDD